MELGKEIIASQIKSFCGYLVNEECNLQALRAEVSASESRITDIKQRIASLNEILEKVSN
jgi:predicted  nucleic acid-binding Zn-ribbon protein